MVTRDEFVKAIAGDIDELPNCDWLFSPVKLRNILMEHINFDEYRDVIDEMWDLSYVFACFANFFLFVSDKDAPRGIGCNFPPFGVEIVDLDIVYITQ